MLYRVLTARHCAVYISMLWGLWCQALSGCGGINSHCSMALCLSLQCIGMLTLISSSYNEFCGTTCLLQVMATGSYATNLAEQCLRAHNALVMSILQTLYFLQPVRQKERLHISTHQEKLVFTVQHAC